MEQNREQMTWCRFLNILYLVEEVLLYSHLLIIFIINGFWILLNAFSGRLDMIKWPFYLYLVDVIDHMNCFFNRLYLFIFRERGRWGRDGEREGEKHKCVVASHMAPTGYLACNQGMCPDWESNQRPLGLQAHTQSTESNQPGLIFEY